jgi:hypothetical protein
MEWRIWSHPRHHQSPDRPEPSHVQAWRAKGDSPRVVSAKPPLPVSVTMPGLASTRSQFNAGSCVPGEDDQLAGRFVHQRR